ncbi:MAG: hypothetical protein HKN88_02515 [Gammaproteobacteria bacterium]|nr:hypothetical protein [Gammaproteobacteria bacterium]NNC96926.1 hypothetical protein [Gammaproteobacteria bacterium]NNM13341.1 hypothetical protein [Gammaproteobacteria bacterium]
MLSGCVHQVVTVPAQTASQGAQTAGQTAQQVVSHDGRKSDQVMASHTPVSQSSARQP